MIVPVRCFSCGKVIGDKWEDFNKRVEAGENPGELLGHVEIIDDVLKFHEQRESPDLRGGTS